jgi:hypothetical protein
MPSLLLFVLVEALEGVLLSKMCTALKKAQILIEWGHSVYPLQELILVTCICWVANVTYFLHFVPGPMEASGRCVTVQNVTSKRQNLCHE